MKSFIIITILVLFLFFIYIYSGKNCSKESYGANFDHAYTDYHTGNDMIYNLGDNTLDTDKQYASDIDVYNDLSRKYEIDLDDLTL